MCHSLPLIPEEREPREGVGSEDLCVLGDGIDHEREALVGDPKVNLFYLNIRSLAVATAHRQGGHPWIVYYNFLISMQWMQRCSPLVSQELKGIFLLF